MTEARLKRRVLPLIFIVKSFKKPLLIRFYQVQGEVIFSNECPSQAYM